MTTNSSPAEDCPFGSVLCLWGQIYLFLHFPHVALFLTQPFSSRSHFPCVALFLTQFFSSRSHFSCVATPRLSFALFVYSHLSCCSYLATILMWVHLQLHPSPMVEGEKRAMDQALCDRRWPLSLRARVRAYIPGVLCFFLSHLSQGCATKVSTLFNYVPLVPENEGPFRKNIGLFRGNMGDFRENKGSFGGNELILWRKKLIFGEEMASVIVV